MKKLLVLIASLAVYMYANAETVKIGNYYTSYFKAEKEVWASKNSDGLYDVMIFVAGEYSESTVAFRVKGENLQSFINSLMLIKQKFVEWDNVAKQNNVKKIVKKFDITFPRVTIAWYGTDWYFSFNHKLEPNFMVLESEGTSHVVFQSKVISSTNEYIDQEYYLVFSSAEEIDSLISIIKPENIKIKMEQKDSQADLFK
jgi:hypothetical protein